MSEKTLFLRSTELELSDDNTVTGRIAPFDEVTEVLDTHPDTGKVSRFKEVMRRGAFQKMIAGLSARGWTGAVSLNLDHKQDVSNTIGYAVEIEERSDGAWGVFKLYEDGSTEKVKSMMRTSHKGMSVGFRPVKHHTDSSGLVERLMVHIDHVAVTPTPQYAGAGVASVRTADIYTDLNNSQDLETPNLDVLKKELEALRI